MAERFAGEHVGQVQLDERDADSEQGIAQRHAGVSESGGIDHDEGDTVLAGGVDAKTLSGILGHTNASFTLDTYTHVTTDMQRNASTIVGSFMDEIMLEGDDTNR